MKMLSHYQFDYDLEPMEAAWLQAVEYLRTLPVTDSEYLINDALAQGKKVLAEGAQGTMLDIDFGTYPFVTSSNTVTAGTCTGLGIAPNRIGDVIGIFKAYCTRVGSGPFPTELLDETGERMRQEGREFGSTTGRPRRCGWLDLPALRYAVMINGATRLAMMKTDILSIFDTIKVCTHYEIDGVQTDQMPYDITEITIKPVYKEFKGWNCDLTRFNENDPLPTELNEYIDFIESALGVPVWIVSVGPDRSQTLIRHAVPA
jgi:adenylosuccinate synthase